MKWKQSSYLCRDGSFWRNLSSQITSFNVVTDRFLYVCFRYRIEYEALSKVESEQNEFIDQFILQKWRMRDGRKRTTCASTLPRVPVPFSRGDAASRESLRCISYSEAIPKLRLHPEHHLFTLSAWHQCVRQPAISLNIFDVWNSGLTKSLNISDLYWKR